eukprot:260732-Pelagomonas_calceolata.AAC.2
MDAPDVAFMNFFPEYPVLNFSEHCARTPCTSDVAEALCIFLAFSPSLTPSLPNGQEIRLHNLNMPVPLSPCQTTSQNLAQAFY